MFEKVNSPLYISLDLNISKSILLNNPRIKNHSKQNVKKEIVFLNFRNSFNTSKQ